MNYLFLLLFLLTNLKERPNPFEKENLALSGNYAQNQLFTDDGLLLLQKHCYTCHNPKSKSHDEIIAPPLWGMKKHYLEAYPEKAAFEKAMIEFIQNPTEEKALMKGPIKRFGLMPKPEVSYEDLQKIVSYIYDQEIENPVWHIEKVNQNKPKSGGLK